MVSMTAHSASTISTGMFKDCECSVPFTVYDWDGVVGGQVYLCNTYLKNTGNKGVYVTYEPAYLNLLDGQARFYIDVYVVEMGTPCDLYSVDPAFALPEKDPAICDRGYWLGPGKVVKLTVVLWAESVVYGETCSWDLTVYGCVP